MLNVKAINAVLSRFPLCANALIAQRGMAIEYCAMGAIAKSLGVSDEELMNKHDSAGFSLFNELRPRLFSNYGIETLNEFQNLMSANDGSRNNATRNSEVSKAATMMGLDEIDRMIRESQADDVANRTEDAEL